MQIEKGRNRIFKLTLSGFELAALISSARWAAEGANERSYVGVEHPGQLARVLAVLAALQRSQFGRDWSAGGRETFQSGSFDPDGRGLRNYCPG